MVKMDWIQDYQLFLFDLDGLLVNTERMHYAAYIEVCRKYGFELKWDFPRFCLEAHGKAMGIWDGLSREFPRLFEFGSKEKLYEEKKHIYIDLLQSYPLEFMDGAEALVTALSESNIPRAVVTNSPKAHIEIIKKSLPLLQTIPLWITREDYIDPKPAPDGYLKAIGMLAKSGDRIIGFEDTLKGLKALIAAGVKGVLICPEDHAHVKECSSLGAQHFKTLSVMNFNQM